ncbi:MAG: TIR domain-containing protein [Candidatus Margulisbacteria bacterium]|nr:TIR domain-containing protein [Candidatus Margulisiibacteriota bacterium]
MYESPLEKLLRETRAREEANNLARLASLLSRKKPQNPLAAFLSRTTEKERRKVFLPYYHGDEDEVNAFVSKWADQEKVFIPKALGISDEDDFIYSDKPEYVMTQIRKKYLQDSTVTMVLIGSCTHSRRYVDWEIKTSLRQGEGYTPNGLIGIVLPSQGNRAILPQRFKDNWNKELKNCYARYYSAPNSADQLRGWIEDAFNARLSRAKYIVNTSDMMKYNSVCKICDITH